MDLDGADYDGRTALRPAASEGQAHIVEHLIAKGVNLNPIEKFGGLNVGETAEALNVSHETVRRDWLLAKAWLYRGLSRETTSDA